MQGDIRAIFPTVGLRALQYLDGLSAEEAEED
jgi:hypothetical protein